jgi:hypothetical protein
MCRALVSSEVPVVDLVTDQPLLHIVSLTSQVSTRNNLELCNIYPRINPSKYSATYQESGKPGMLKTSGSCPLLAGVLQAVFRLQH